MSRNRKSAKRKNKHRVNRIGVKVISSLREDKKEFREVAFICLGIMLILVLNQFSPIVNYTGSTITDSQNMENVQRAGDSLESLKIKEVNSTVYAFKTLNDDIIEIGEEAHSPPQPYLKLNKWDGEATMKVDIPYGSGGTKSIEQEDIRWSTEDYYIDFYPKQPETYTEDIAGKQHTFTINQEGGVEFDLILKKRPESNIFEFPIATENLEFYYQPALHPEHPTWADKNGDGIADSFRPENVVGSYAVYHSSKSGNEYKAGKAFHIYKPKIYDSEGNWTWGMLSINESVNTLKVTVPQKFLDTAVYPVTIDPSFGYDGEGASITTIEEIFVGSLFTLSEDGTINNMTVSLSNTQGVADPVNTQTAIYKHSDNSLEGTTTLRSISYTTTKTWEVFDFETEPELTSGDYILGVSAEIMTGFPPDDPLISYDSGDADQSHQNNSVGIGSGDSWYDPVGGWFHDNNKFSIYANYTVSDSPPQVSIQSPTNTTYTSNPVYFNLTLNEAGSWCGYSLNGTSNVTMSNVTGDWEASETLGESAYNVKFYCNDTAGNMNGTEEVFFKVTNAPKYWDNSTNNTDAGQPTLFSLNWTDNVGLGGYIFSTNNTGTWQNDSFTDFENATGDALFINSFEEGDFSAWDGTATSDGGCTAEVASNNVYHGSYSGEFTTDGTYEGAYAYKDVAGQSRLNSRFYMRLPTIGDGKSYFVAYTYSSGLGSLYRLYVRNNSGTFQWGVRWYDGGLQSIDWSTQHNPSAGTFYCVEMEYTKGDGTGEVKLYVEGSELTDVTHSNLASDYDATGGRVGIAADSSDYGGTVTVDRYVIADTYIGPDNTGWSNITKTLNSTANIPIGWRVYANDTSDNWNASEIFTLTTADTKPPKYYDNSTNNTDAGQPTLFSLNWTDNVGLGGYIFSWHNGANTTMSNETSDQESGTISYSPSYIGSNANITLLIYTDEDQGSNSGFYGRTKEYGTDSQVHYMNVTCTEGSYIINKTNDGILGDARVRNDAPTTNYATDEHLSSYGATNPASRSYAIFNLSKIGDCSAITSAEWYIYSSTLYAEINHYAGWVPNHTLTETTWDGASLTWNNQPCGSTLGSLVASANCNTTKLDTVSVGSTGVWYKWNLQDIVNNETGIGSSLVDENSTYTTYDDVASDIVSDKVKNITVTVNVSEYTNTVSSGSSSDPDLWLEIYDGSSWNEIGNMSVTSTGNFSKSTQDSTVLSGWDSLGNRDIRIKAVYLDSSGGTWDQVNYTDVWIKIDYEREFMNDTWMSFSGGTWSNVTKTINSTTGANIRWRVYANDTSDNWNASEVFTFTTTGADSTPPQVSIQSPTNQTYTSNPIEFNVTLDEAGSWCGYSLNGTSNVTMSNVTGDWEASETLGNSAYNVKFYCNDTVGNMNGTEQQYFTVNVDYEAPKYWDNSTNNTDAGQPTLFSLNWTDNVGLGGYIFSTNNTGTWQNDSFTDFENATGDAIFIDGFESGDFSAWTDSPGTVSVINTDCYSGSYCLKAETSENSYAGKSIADKTLRYDRLYVKFGNLPTSGHKVVFKSRYTGSTVGRIAVMNDSGTMKWGICYDALDNYNWFDTPNPTTDIWYSVESKFVSQDELELWIDGNSIGTVETSEQYITGLSVGSMIKSEAITVHIDRVVISDNYIGPDNTGWSNVTKTLNSTVGTPIGWRVYANDTSDNCNASEIFTLTTTDSTPPQVSIQSPTNQTYTSNPIEFNVTLDEEGSWCGYSLNGTANVSMTNTTGDWEASETLGNSAYNVKFYCNDTSGNMNGTEQQYFTVNVDYEAPKYYDNSTNNTIAGQSTLFSLNWTDNVGLGGYIFSTNNTGTWQNDSFVDFSFGKTEIGSSSRVNPTYAYVYGPWSLSSNDTVRTIYAYFKVSGIDARVAIYNDTGGEPDSLKVESASESVGSVGWYEFEVTDTELVAGDYWFGVQRDSGGANALAADYISGRERYISHAYGEFPDPWDKGGDSQWNYDASIYASFGTWSNVTKTLNSTIGSNVAWRVYANDTSDNWNTSEIFILTTTDGTPPSFSDNQSQLVSTYNPSSYSNFSINWTDNSGSVDAYVEHNFTGTLQNESMDGSYPTFTYNSSVLGVADYQFRMVANDSSGNDNATDWMYFTITKTSPSLSISLTNNNTDYGLTDTAECSITTGDSSTLTLYRNGTQVASGTTPISESTVLPAGYWNYTCTYVATQNYTSTSTTSWMLINKAKPVLIMNNATATVNTSNLVGYWRFEEGTGTDVSDSSGYGNDGTVSGAAWTSGRFGNALEFDGSNDYVDVHHDTLWDLKATDDITVNAWIKLASDTSGDFGNIWGDWAGPCFQIHKESSGSYWLNWYGGGEKKSDLLTFEMNKWYHVVVVREGGSTIRWYRNGELVGTAVPDEIDKDPDYVWIGGDEAGENFNGTIDEVMIFNRSLTSDEVRELYESRVTYGTSTTFTLTEEGSGDTDVNYKLYRNESLDVTNTENGTAVQLPAGYHYYIANATEGQNYTERELLLPLNITKADTSVYMHLAINGSESNQVFMYPNATNVTGWSTLGILSYDLYRNDTLIGGGNPQSDIALLGAGTYTYIYNTSGNQNYSIDSVTRTLGINQQSSYIRPVTPNTSTPVRGEGLRINTKLNYPNGAGVQGKILNFTDKTVDTDMGDNSTDSTGYTSIDYTIPVDSGQGTHNINVSFAGDDNVSSSYNNSVNVTVYSRANITFETGGQSVTKGDVINLEAIVRDAKNGSAIANYPCNFYDNSTPLMLKTLTNVSGYCNYTWNTNEADSGSRVVEVNITANATMYYFTAPPNDTSKITVSIFTPPTVSEPGYNVTPSEILRGDGVYINCNITDEVDSADELEVNISVKDASGVWSNVSASHIGDTFYRNYQTDSGSPLGTYTVVCTAKNTYGLSTENSSTFLVWQNATIDISLNQTSFEWGEYGNVSTQTAYLDTGYVSSSSISISVAGSEECSGTTDAEGKYSCIFPVPQSIGTHTVTVQVTDASTAKVFTNSTQIVIIETYGEGETERSMARDVGCYEVPKLIQNPDGSIKKVMVKICVWK